MRRWLRCLVCLLVICALLINLSPLRVKATGVTAGGVVVGVGITVAVAAALNALGVRQGSDSSSFSEIVNSCAEALSPRFAVDGLVTFLSLTQNGLGRTYASTNFLQAILDFIFGNEIVSSTSGTLLESSCTMGSFTPGFRCDSPLNYCIVAYNPFSYNGSLSYYMSAVIIGDSSYSYLSLSRNSYYSLRNISGNVYASSLESTVSADPISICDGWPVCVLPDAKSLDEAVLSVDLSTVNSGVITTAQDLTLESVGQDVDTDYKTYVDTGIVDIEWGVHFEENGDGSDDDNGDGMIGVPVRIPDLSTDSFTDQTQEEAQTGDTPQDILDQLLQQMGGGGSGSGSGDGTGSGNTGNTGNTWVPPSSHTQFALADLSKFFPFCIPFDLFDFFTLLDADPVAPVLSWEIQDLSGQSYALSVNLSEWDSVAQLFRRLQLFLFISGLAAASRKYIKW